MYCYDLRDVHRWKKKVFWHSRLKLLKNKGGLNSGIHSFQEGGLFFDFLLENNNSNTTVVFFNPAMDRGDRFLPFFVGNKVLQGLDVNRLHVSDPSLLMSNSIRLAWYAAISNGLRVQDVLLEALQIFLQKLQSKKIIFFGPSNGGFAALFFSYFFESSIAVVVNPQTRILDFSRDAVKEFAYSCLGVSKEEDIEGNFEKIFSDLRILYANGFANNIVYIQNKSDHHVETQMNPFVKGLGKEICIIMGDWGEGHVAPPSYFIRDKMSLIIKDSDEIISQEYLNKLFLTK